MYVYLPRIYGRHLGRGFPVAGAGEGAARG